jgi:NADP-dependent 3-hydroxy acid dehydrogenase YdfG
VAELSGKVAAITGASSGIGEATAITLAAAGCSVALGARRVDRLEALAQKISDQGGSAEAFEVDVADETQARAFVDGAAERFGRLDILVNNAGLMLNGPFESSKPADWRTMVNVNLLGLLYCTHAAIPIMRAQGGGDVVNLSSIAGRTARAGSSVYNLTKFGVGAFSEALRQEAIEAKIRVILVEPGFVDTELQGHNSPAVLERIEGMRDQIGEVLVAQDIADGILFSVTRPPRASVNEILIRPSGQER